MAHVAKTEFDLLDWVSSFTLLAVMFAGWVWLGVEMFNHINSSNTELSRVFLAAPFLGLLTMYAVKDVLILLKSEKNKANFINHTVEANDALQDLID